MEQFSIYKSMPKEKAEQISKDYQKLVGTELFKNWKIIRKIIPHPSDAKIISQTVTSFANNEKINTDWVFNDDKYFVLILASKDGLLDDGIDLILYLTDLGKTDELEKYGI